jgi:hypothetical protein
MRKAVVIVLFLQSLLVGAQISLPIQQSNIPKNHLVVNYDFSNTVSYSGTGTAVNNIASTTTGSATLLNSPGFIKTLGYASFNGVNQYIITPDLKSYFKSVAAATIQDSHTISLWIYPLNANGIILSEFGAGSISTTGWQDSQIEMVNGFLKFRVWPSTTDFLTSTNTIALNQWHHIVMVYDGANLKGYVDGVLQGTKTYARQSPINYGYGLHYGIGAYTATDMGSAAYGRFNLAQFKMYNIPLNDSDIAQEYKREKLKYEYGIHSPDTNTNPSYWSISSAWDNINASNGPGDAFSIYHFTPWLNSSLGWAAQQNNTSQFITLNYDEPVTMNGIVTQGRANNGNQWVSSAHIDVSIDGLNWTRVVSNAILNTNSIDDVRVLFPSPVFAKYIRVSPLTWNNHITMRLGVIVEPQQLVTDGLVVRLDAANSKSYPGTGTTWNDVNSTSFPFTLTNGPVYDTNGFFDFDGANDYAVIANTAALKPTVAITLEQWLNADDWNAGTSSSNYKCSLSCTSGGGYSHNIWSGTFTSYLYAGGAYRTPSTNVSTLVGWHHFVTTFDGRYTRLYVDGELKSTIDIGTTGNLISYVANSIFVGAEASGRTAPEGFYWNGKIGTTAIYNRALSATEIAQNYTVSKRYSLTSDNLVLHYNPASTESYSGTGTTIRDLSGNGLNGTMSNLTYTESSFTYNGASSQISIPDNALLEPGTGSWTMEAWFKPTQFTANSKTVLGKFDNGGQSSIISYALRQGNGFIRADFSNGTTAFISDNYSLSLNNWVQMVYVWDKTNNTLYTYSNGVLKQSKAITITGGLRNSATNLFLGSYNGGEYAQYFTGQIGTVRLYKKALNTTEVQNNYNSNKALYGL